MPLPMTSKVLLQNQCKPATDSMILSKKCSRCVAEVVGALQHLCTGDTNSKRMFLVSKPSFSLPLNSSAYSHQRKQGLRNHSTLILFAVRSCIGSDLESTRYSPRLVQTPALLRHICPVRKETIGQGPYVHYSPSTQNRAPVGNQYLATNERNSKLVSQSENIFVFRDRVFICSLGCPETHYED